MLLLSCPLGDRNARPLSPARFRDLGQLIRLTGSEADPLGRVTAAALRAAGCDPTLAGQVEKLLSREAVLDDYLARGEALGIVPVTRISPDYPDALAAKLRFDAPRVLFCLGDRTLLHRPAVALVGSRHLRPENEAFARRVGQLAAAEGLTLVTGGAVGADRAALETCLARGGAAVVYVPDVLTLHPARDRCLFVSVAGYDLPFSPARALGRNPLIHAHAPRTLAAQCTLHAGGTWQGCTDNLRRHLSELYVFDDGSDGAAALLARGAVPVKALTSLGALLPDQCSLL